ncbi:hypothetical protein [Roseivirga misakiensis]|uniref:Anti-sigma factor n=1 Tax=Roseivirga misakiensis TaxID=1563681 RepID=A0A1E5T1D6_9BACT|nr:hypothetical protein [Roseivirga misakiensis]OEK05175.1 hypothetical protein BFP71_17350 [Roseivirga misakiensis]
MQGKDNLENFIRNNRAEFDDKSPSDNVWNAIERDLEPKTTNQLWYWKAAVFLLVGAVTFLLIDRPNQDQVSPNIDEQQALLETANLEKFEELETFYSSIISNKISKLEGVEEDAQFDYLEAEIKNLDVLYSDLKNVFLESQQSEEVLDRLIHILRQKIHLINSELDILESDRLPEEMRKEVGLSM